MVLQLEARLYKTEGFNPNIEQPGIGKIEGTYNAHLLIRPLHMGRPLVVGMLRQEAGTLINYVSDDAKLLSRVYPLSIEDTSISLHDPSVIEKAREVYDIGSRLLGIFHNLHFQIRGILNVALAETSDQRLIGTPARTLAYYFTGAKEGCLYIPYKMKPVEGKSNEFVADDSHPSALFHFEYPLYDSGSEKGMVIPFRSTKISWELDEGGVKRNQIEQRYRKHSGMWISHASAKGLLEFAQTAEGAHKRLAEIVNESILAEREVQEGLLKFYSDLEFR